MRGIVIGKFYPPHKGHNYLIDTALKIAMRLMYSSLIIHRI